MGKEGQNGKDPLFKILICSTNVFLREVCLPFWFRLLFEKFLKNDQGYLIQFFLLLTHANTMKLIDSTWLFFFDGMHLSFFFENFYHHAPFIFFFRQMHAPQWGWLNPLQFFPLREWKIMISQKHFFIFWTLLHLCAQNDCWTTMCNQQSTFFSNIFFSKSKINIVAFFRLFNALF